MAKVGIVAADEIYEAFYDIAESRDAARKLLLGMPDGVYAIFELIDTRKVVHEPSIYTVDVPGLELDK